jgi:protein-S-isoprenylcysteine O-methyltransferase Ste14
MMKSYRIKPPTYLLIAILAAVTLHFALPVFTLIPSPWTLLGLIPLVLGLVINLNADQSFHKANTPAGPFDVPSTLVTSGPYRFTRNPMYLGFVFILLGVSVLMGSFAPYVIVFGFALLMDRVFIDMEEQKLSRAFGSAWQEYQARTHRWL